MISLAKHIEFVKSQQVFHERQVLRYPDNLRRQERHNETAEKFKTLADCLNQLEEKLANDSVIGSGLELQDDQYRLALTRDDVEGLPEELMNELSVSDVDKSEFNIIALIEESGGVATLDRILVALYRQNGEIMKRATLNARLYRMSQRALIHSVPGKKGVYSVKPLSEEDINKLK